MSPPESTDSITNDSISSKSVFLNGSMFLMEQVRYHPG